MSVANIQTLQNYVCLAFFLPLQIDVTGKVYILVCVVSSVEYLFTEYMKTNVHGMNLISPSLGMGQNLYSTAMRW